MTNRPSSTSVDRSISAESSSLCATLVALVDKLDQEELTGTEVIGWSCPVLSFGSPYYSQVATVGINPSNREFVDETGVELNGPNRRFHTLESLGLTSWSSADARHLSLILETYSSYFSLNPYSSWFRPLEVLLSGIDASYYDFPSTACHFDLIPYATSRKWSELSSQQQSTLLRIAGNTLGLMVRDSLVELLILNGHAVVKQVESLCGIRFKTEPVPSWVLPRKATQDVQGIAFRGRVDTLAGIQLGREVELLGFNHNLQGSFGVSNTVVSAIKDWISQNIEYEKW